MCPVRISRRKLLSGGAVLATYPVAGCGEKEPPRETDSARRNTTEGIPADSETSSQSPTDTTSPTDSPTSEPPCVGGGETRLAFGEWHQYGDLHVTVSSLELLTELRLDDGTTVQMPDDELFALITMPLENRTGVKEYFSTTTAGPVFLSEPCAVSEPALNFDVLDGEESYDRLAAVEHTRQYRPDGYRIDAGSSGKVWYAAVLPRSAEREGLEIGWGGPDGDYPVRWIPKKGTATP